jgi:hypothetical protein
MEKITPFFPRSQVNPSKRLKSNLFDGSPVLVTPDQGVTNNDLFSASCLSIYHTPALGDTSYDTLAFKFKVIQSQPSYRTVLLGEMLFFKIGTSGGTF